MYDALLDDLEDEEAPSTEEAAELVDKDEVVDELRRRGHNVARSRGDFGGYQAIMIDWEKGTLFGGTEARKDGCAVGY